MRRFNGLCVGDKPDNLNETGVSADGFVFVKVINYTLVQDIGRFICEIDILHRLQTRKETETRGTFYL